MTKLNYPSEGIYRYCRDDFELCISNLSKVISTCNLDVPANFTYKNYLNNLPSLLNEYYKEIDSINSKLQKSNKNYDNLSDALSTSTNRMESLKIKERDRMII